MELTLNYRSKLYIQLQIYGMRHEIDTSRKSQIYKGLKLENSKSHYNKRSSDH